MSSKDSNAEKINKVLFTLADAVNTTPNLNHLYKTIHNTLGRVIDVTNFFIAIVDKQKKTLYFPYFVDSTDDDFAPIDNFETESSLTGLVVSQKKPLLLNRRKLLERQQSRGIWGPMPLSWMGVPLIIRKEVIGVIAVQSYDKEATYSKEDLDILSAISHQTAIAIDRKRSLDDIQLIKERQSFALQATGSCIWDWDLETEEIYLDDNHYRIAGYQPQEYASKREEWEKRVHPDDLARIADALALIREGHQSSYRSEYRYKRKSGEWMWILSQGKVVLWTKDKKPSRFIGTHTDISQQKTADEKLKQSEKVYRNIFLNAQIGLFRMRLKDLKLIECNDAIAGMLGYSHRTECLRHFSAPKAYVSKRSLRNVLRKLIEDGEVRGDIAQFYRKDGSLAWLRTSVKIFSDEDYIEGVVDDITELKTAQEEKNFLQEQLERSKKMEALGLLAGSVAHDLNNILSGIISYPELLLLKIGENSDLVAPLEAIRDSGKRAATVVSDMLTVARSAASIKTPWCLHTIISDFLNSPECMQYIKLYPNIRIETKMQAKQSNILCSPTHVTKSLMNLIINGLEAIGDTGTVSIATNNPSPAKDSGISGTKGTIVLTVHDTGTGISQKDIPHIFEPFYSQKIMGKSGTGLGLTIVWDTVENHDGQISVESDHSGTQFTLFFPTTENTNTKQPALYDINRFMGDGEHILIVDDEPQLRDIARQILTSLGYNCTEVHSGEAAIEYLKNNSIDLVLLDMLMPPGLNGRETYDNILNIHPQQKAIIASGYSDNRELDLALRRGVGAFVKKPYSIKQLSVVVKELLNTPLQPKAPY